MRPGADSGTTGLLGVVLCGGGSRRMGRDKGLIERDGICWAARMGMMLAPFGLPVVYSVRVEQEPAYAAVLPEACMVADAVEIGGPLNGLFSVHYLFPESDLLLLACDMQDMDGETIGELIRGYKSGGAEYYMYDEGGFAQPFCAVYTAAALQRAYGGLGEERSLRGMIRMGVVRTLAVRRREAFGNYNS